MYKEGFASRIKHAREKTGFSQREVSRETGILQSNISQYENGKLEPDVEKLGILVDFYGCSADWLLGLSPQDREPNYIREDSQKDKLVKQFIKRYEEIS